MDPDSIYGENNNNSTAPVSSPSEYSRSPDPPTNNSDHHHHHHHHQQQQVPHHPPQLSHPRLPSSCEPPSSSNPPKQLVWLIFGATGHLGRSLCRVTLARGDLVTAVGRNIPEQEAQMHGWHPRCQGLVCDVRVRETISDVVEKALAHWGRIDVVANCSGYGIIGACEDQDEHDIRAQFDTNLMGTVNIIQLTLPYFRERGAGRHIIFSSISGIMGTPGLGPYCATKWALEGLTESLMYEVEPFGIKATLVEPGSSRRDEPDEILGGNLPPMWGHFLLKPPAEIYKAASSPAQHATRMVDWLRHRQPTSAVGIADVVWELGHCAHPPLRLILGSDAIDGTRDRLRSTIEEIEDWKHLNVKTDDDDDAGGMSARTGTGTGTEREDRSRSR